MENNHTQNIHKYQIIEKAIAYLEEHVHHQPSLETLAAHCNMSPFHFQRVFSEWAGISPKRFLQYLTTEFLKQHIHTLHVSEAADVVGLSSTSRVHDLFVSMEGVTPHEYKTLGKGIEIQYGFHATPFGLGLIGVTSKGICWFSFYAPSDEAQAMKQMREHWQDASLLHNPSITTPYINVLFHTAQPNTKIHVFVKGTNFQIQVWKALLQIPLGDVTTYQHVATQVGNPKATQAVGSAVGANHIAWLIPCHRVIRKDGVLGAYRWDSTRKKSIIGWEMAQKHQ